MENRPTKRITAEDYKGSVRVVLQEAASSEKEALKCYWRGTTFLLNALANNQRIVNISDTTVDNTLPQPLCQPINLPFFTDATDFIN